jgi:hypothetical protein
VDARQLGYDLVIVVPVDVRFDGIGLEDPHDTQRRLVRAGKLVVAEQRAGLRMPRLDERVDLIPGEL